MKFGERVAEFKQGKPAVPASLSSNSPSLAKERPGSSDERATISDNTVLMVKNVFLL